MRLLVQVLQLPTRSYKCENLLSHALLSISPILYAMLDIRSNGDAIAITNFKNGVAPIGNAIAVAAGND